MTEVPTFIISHHNFHHCHHHHIYSKNVGGDDGPISTDADATWCSFGRRRTCTLANSWFVQFWDSGEAKFPKMCDSVPWTPMCKIWCH